MAKPPSRDPGAWPRLASWLWLALFGAIGCGDASIGIVPAAPEPGPTPPASSAPAPAAPGRAGDGPGPVYYRYVDADGALRFVARLEDVPQAARASAKAIPGGASTTPARRASSTAGRPTHRPWSEPAASQGPAPRTEAGARAQHVVVYTTSWCPWCRKTLAFLDAKHVEYVNKDIEKNPAWRNELVEKTGSAGVPVVEIDGQRIDGFDESALERLL